MLQSIHGRLLCRIQVQNCTPFAPGLIIDVYFICLLCGATE